VSNPPGNPRGRYEVLYCERGEMEDRIKEQQLMPFADRTSRHKFLANQFRLLLSAAAYVLVEAVRRLALAGTALERAPAAAVRVGGVGRAGRARGVPASGGRLPAEGVVRPGAPAPTPASGSRSGRAVERLSVGQVEAQPPLPPPGGKGAVCPVPPITSS